MRSAVAFTVAKGDPGAVIVMGAGRCIHVDDFSRFTMTGPWDALRKL